MLGRGILVSCWHAHLARTTIERKPDTATCDADAGAEAEACEGSVGVVDMCGVHTGQRATLLAVRRAPSFRREIYKAIQSYTDTRVDS